MPTFDSLKLVDDLIARADPRIQSRFAAIVLQIRNEHSLDELATLISNGQIDEALSALEAASARLATTVNDAFAGAGTAALDELGDKLGIVVSYDGTNVRAVRKMAERRLDIIRGFTVQQQDATRMALIDGIERGLNPIAQARNFRQSVGLTPNQQGYIMNYRTQLESLDSRALNRALRDGRFDASVKRAIRDQKPLTKAQVERMVGRYQERWIKHRSEVIARTESLSAVHQGLDEGIQQAVDSGSVDRDKVRRFWNTAGDERVRDFNSSSTSHRSMHLQERKLGEPFESGAGSLLMFPGDPAAPLIDTAM